MTFFSHIRALFYGPPEPEKFVDLTAPKPKPKETEHQKWMRESRERHEYHMQYMANMWRIQLLCTAMPALDMIGQKTAKDHRIYWDIKEELADLEEWLLNTKP